MIDESRTEMVVDGWAGAALSRRELEVLQGMAEGLTHKGIGLRLRLRRQSIKNIALSMRRKLKARSCGEAVAIGMRRGLIK